VWTLLRESYDWLAADFAAAAAERAAQRRAEQEVQVARARQAAETAPSPGGEAAVAEGAASDEEGSPVEEGSLSPSVHG
jgi:aromatic-L-amino-acid decarboxylase